MYFISRSHLERQSNGSFLPPPQVPPANESGDAWTGRPSTALRPEAMYRVQTLLNWRTAK